MSNPKNPNKNVDPSNNNNINLIITSDSSKNIINNLFFSPLQDSKRDKSDNNNQVTTDNKKTDINGNNVLFLMKINGILNELRKSREEKNKNSKIRTWSQLARYKLFNNPDFFCILFLTKIFFS